MKRLAQSSQASVVVAFLFPVVGNGQARDWAFDFRMIDSATVDDASMTGVSTGHVVVSKGRVRLNMMSGVFGGANKAYTNKMQIVRLKLPRAPELRAVQRTLMTSSGMESDIKTIREVTSIKRVTAGRELFAVPPGYKKVDMPGPIAPVGK